MDCVHSEEPRNPKERKKKTPQKNTSFSINLNLIAGYDKFTKFSIELKSALFLHTSQDLPNEVKTRGIKLP
jgi:hypothetical protein